MKTLNELGFIIGADEAHQQKINQRDFTSEYFFEYAEPLLKKLNEVVISEIIPSLEKYSGKWHPLGFMVFPLGIHNELGSLRLHIWPEGKRVKIDGGSGIHNHGWYIASYVVAGTYSDERYRIKEVADKIMPNEQLPKDLLRVFQATKRSGLPDALTTDGSVVKIVSSDKIEMTAGKIHKLEPKVFHLPTISDYQLAVTLVLDSPSLGDKPKILIQRDSVEPIYNPRPKIKEKDAIRAKEQILNNITS